MITLTKEWLQQKIADMEARRDDPWLGLDEDDSNTLAALRIALASLEAEPVAWRVVFKLDGQPGSDFEKTFENQAKMNEIISLHERAGFFASITPLYAAPPATVSVMDEAQSRELFEKNCMANIERNKWHPDLYAHLPAREQWAAWEACRAAILQGAKNAESPTTMHTAPALDSSPKIAESPTGINKDKSEPVTTAYKLRDAVEIIRDSGIAIDAEKIFAERDALNAPDCWCRTCRPITLTDMRFVVCPDCGNKRCPHANDHRNSCTGSNEPGQEGSAYPAAPQQEVK